MNARQFFDKVVRMRELQKEYFKTRRPADLQRSKAVEKEIDDEIARVQRIEWERLNPPIFPEYQQP